MLGAVVGTGVGVLVAVSASSLGWRLFGVWVAGVGLNYVPLALHALSLSRGGSLAGELAGIDIPHHLRRYTKTQLWIVVPLLFAVLAVAQSAGRPR